MSEYPVVVVVGRTAADVRDWRHDMVSTFVVTSSSAHRLALCPSGPAVRWLFVGWDNVRLTAVQLQLLADARTLAGVA